MLLSYAVRIVLSYLSDRTGLWHRSRAILRAAERRGGKDPNTSAAIADSQSIKTTEEG